MKKEAFNKENPSDLFSQLIKVLERKELHDIAQQIRDLSKEFFKKRISMNNKISSKLDIIADKLEAQGLTKEAEEIDVVSNTIESAFMPKRQEAGPWQLGTPPGWVPGKPLPKGYVIR